MGSARVFAHVWTALRAAAAALAVVAVVHPASVVIGGAIESGRDVATVAGNFFSFFTVLFNIFGAAVLMCCAGWFWSRRRAEVEPRLLAVSLAAATTCLLVTGIVYNFQPPGMEVARTVIVPWSNVVLHIVMPLFFAADLLVGPNRRPLPARSVLTVLSLPTGWTFYVLLRANLVTNTITGVPYWYPYPFLNPYQPGGYLRVLLYISALAVVITAVAFLVIVLGRIRGRRGTR